MSQIFLKRPNGFPLGLTDITRADEAECNTGIQFSILKLQAEEKYHILSTLETAVILMTGQVVFKYAGKVYEGQRNNLFEQDPHVLHVPQSSPIDIIAGTDCELAIVQTHNAVSFEEQVFNQDNMLESEHRGQGLLDDTAYRIVRTVFDKRNRLESNLVIGEVITFPGCWSSYPPHHHPQPEIYHYRFTEPQGYGHAECGDEIFKAESFSTLKILDNRDHAQVAAPGYGMYYLWLIRHLPENSYTIPEFTRAHDWTKSTQANERVWKGKSGKKGNNHAR